MPDSEHTKKLRRLERVWIEYPIYFVTTCTHQRKRILADDEAVSILRKEWEQAQERYGWCVGRYVVMPDHVHFFCREASAEPESLGKFVGSWKQWTAKRLIATKAHEKLKAPVWQKQFFDHVLRSGESYSEKWQYVFSNPVRHGYVGDPEDWPWAGEIESFIF